MINNSIIEQIINLLQNEKRTNEIHIRVKRRTSKLDKLTLLMTLPDKL